MLLLTQCVSIETLTHTLQICRKIKQIHTGVSSNNVPYVYSSCGCPARLTPMLHPDNPMMCMSHTYPDREARRLGQGLFYLIIWLNSIWYYSIHHLINYRYYIDII